MAGDSVKESANIDIKEIELDYNSWEYKNEGACNIILTYCGDIASPLVRL